jgi:hypothetical protein
VVMIASPEQRARATETVASVHKVLGASTV